MSELKIGFSPCFFHSDPQRAIFKGKTLIYLEQSMAHWLMNEGALPILVLPPQGPIDISRWVAHIDGLLLQGGSDISPQSYGESPIDKAWLGDPIRDQYEISLIKECHRQNKPILGICRGAQIINVAFNGTLYQDLATQLSTALIHRDWNIYDQLFHEIQFEEASLLNRIYSPLREGRVNSVHHQGIKTLGENLVVEARSKTDGVIEAIRYESSKASEKDNPFILAVQWHPEFQNPSDPSLLNPNLLLKEFLYAAKVRKTA